MARLLHRGPAPQCPDGAGHFRRWGYFDYRFKGEGFDEGYQSVPVNWGISSERKRGFFTLLQEITGAAQP